MQRKAPRHLIHGVLTTTSDFVVTAFGKGYYDLSDPKNPQVRAGAPDKQALDNKFPCTRTVKLPVLANRAEQAALVPEDESAEHFHDEASDGASQGNAAPEAAVNGRGKEKPQRNFALMYLPVFPSSLLRGRLRREMTEVILDILQTRGDLLDLGSFRGLTSGNATGSPDGVGATFAQTSEFQRSPLIGLFGGGPKLIASALTTFTAYPICDATLAIGMVPASFDTRKNEAAPHRMTNVRVRTRKDDTIGTNINLRMLAAVKDAPGAIAEWLRELSGGKAEVVAESEETAEGGAEEGAEGGRSKLKVSNIFCTESVIPGVNFYARFIVDNELLDLAGLGLFLLCLERMANIQRLGSMGAHGFGMFNLDLTIHNADDMSVPGLPVFERELGTGRYLLNRAVESVSAALLAWEGYSEKVTSAELARLYVPAPQAKPGKAKKGAAAVAA